MEYSCYKRGTCKINRAGVLLGGLSLLGKFWDRVDFVDRM